MLESNCKYCNSILTNLFIDLGNMPLANSFLNEDDLSKEEFIMPLKVYVCKKCYLVQLKEYEIPEKIFSDYAYFSSFSESWLKHAKEYTEMISKRLDLDENSLVIEIASNDGYLLQYFDKKIPVLGIEPAKNIAEVAKKKNIQTLNKFFTNELSNELSKSGKNADLIIGNNVFAHVPNINDFLKGLKTLLKKDGIITLEFPHLLELIKQNQFDTIYHEHLSYFSFTVVKEIFSFHELEIFDVEKLKTHGGSLRIYVKHKNNLNLPNSDKIDKLLKEEFEYGLTNISFYNNFEVNVKKNRKQFIEFITDVKNQNKKIACYGAPAKGNTFLNYCKVDSKMIDYTVDKNPHKQKKFLPGVHIPIKDPYEIKKTKPDYLIILPWNLKDEIKKENEIIKDWNGKFVVAIPNLEIL